MKIFISLILCLFLESYAFCDIIHFNALEKTINSFSDLDESYRKLKSSPTKNNLNNFKHVLINKINTFDSMKNTVNKNLNEPLNDYSEIFFDVVKEIDKNLSSNELSNFNAIEFKLSFIVHVSMGIASGLVLEKSKLVINDNEIKKIQTQIKLKFGKKIQGNNQINGDTPFARSVSLLNGFLKNYNSN